MKPWRSPRLTLVLTLVLLAGCGNDSTPNALRPAGDEAETTAIVTWVLFAVAGAVGLAVVAAILWGALRSPQRRPFGDDAFIAVGGVGLPTLVLVGVAVMTVWATVSTCGRPAADPMPIEVIGHQYWWEVTYPDSGVVTANEITIPADRPVDLLLRSADVIHSFWIPELAGKQDLIPGRTNHLELSATETGTYWGLCAEFCGEQHAGMGIAVIALDGPDFDEWLADRTTIDRVTDPRAERGRAVFEAAACGGCHRIADTASEGEVGPDLTHLSTRLTIGAGVLDNTAENLKTWITDVQDVKPGAHMLEFEFNDDDLDALVAYLEAER